jgi:hypothetical protein
MRNFFVVLCCLTILVSAGGCQKQLRQIIGQIQGQSDDGGEEDNEEAQAVRYNADTRYHNSYLDFSYTVPKGWWLYRLYEDNFSEDPGETANEETLDINYGTDAGKDYSFIGMISFANLQLSTRDNHLGFYLSAETLDDINTLPAYMEYLETYMLEPDHNTYELLDSGGTSINGVQYERRVFEVIREEDNYHFLTFSRPVKNGYYLTIKVSYWPENKNAESQIISALSKAMP